jgi:CMP-N-acetylneuraminic acid synthetase
MIVIAFVPIKLKSQRLPGKNLLPLMGKPMCYHIFETLLKSKYIYKTYVYCSDESIKEYVPQKVEFLKRPERLDKDEVKGLEIYQEFIREVRADVYVLAHATSPFLRTKSIDNAIKKVLSGGYDSAFSAQKIQTFSWYNGKPINYKLQDVPRTQDIKPVLVETSGFYIFRKNVIEGGRRIGEKPWIEIVSNIEAIDVDEKEDYEIALKISG